MVGERAAPAGRALLHVAAERGDQTRAAEAMAARRCDGLAEQRKADRALDEPDREHGCLRFNRLALCRGSLAVIPHMLLRHDRCVLHSLLSTPALSHGPCNKGHDPSEFTGRNPVFLVG